MFNKKWKKKSFSVSSVEEVVCNNLHLKTIGEINNWFSKSEADGYSIVGIKKAAVKILGDKNRPIFIAGDYDVDGKTATVTIVRTLRFLGFTDVSFRIPHRFSEGYGLNEVIIDEIPDNAILITVDNGIAAFDAIEKTKKRGIYVILTDHHLPPANESGKIALPNADIIIDPNAVPDTADFSGYCGCGIAFKLAKKLIFLSESKGEICQKEADEFLDKLMSYVAISTIADVVPLVEENYVFVKKGLTLLSESKTFNGMRALLTKLWISGHVTEYDVGYAVAPCINADNRLDDLSTAAMDLLLADDLEQAESFARQLFAINQTRKQLVAKASNLAELIIEKYQMSNDIPFVINLGKTCEGLAGIIAGKLCEKYNRPAIVLCETDAGLLKGSARSVPGVNIHTMLTHVSNCLEVFGGHEMAAGLTIKPENFRTFKEKIKEYAERNVFIPEDTGETFYDLEIDANDVPAYLKEVRKYAPFGEANPNPVFIIKNFVPVREINGNPYKELSCDGVKMSAENVTAVGFGMLPDFIGKTFSNISLSGTLSENYFRGSITPQISFLDYNLEP